MAPPVLEDPRAQDLLAAVAADVERLAAAFRRAAATAGEIGQEVGAAAGDPLWQGAAATAFRRAVGPLPGEMSRIVDGYGAVADALDGYARELADLTGALRSLIAPLESGDEPVAAPARAAAWRVLDAFEIARDGCRARIAAAQGSAPVVAPAPAPTGTGSGVTVLGG